jgi:hypothetical protein
MDHQQTIDAILSRLRELESLTLSLQPQTDLMATTSAELQRLLDTAPDGATVHLLNPLSSPIILKPRYGRLAVDCHRFSCESLLTLGPADGYTVRNLSAGYAGIGTGKETSLDALPSRITLDNVTVVGDQVNGQKRGISLHGRDGITLTNCHVWGIFTATKQDSQAVYINNGPGPYSLIHCELEAASENILIGGDSIRFTPGGLPADILVDGCTLSKPLDWRGKGYQVKNLLELKNAARVTVRNTVMDGTWKDAQDGSAVLLTPINQYGDTPWAEVRDVLFEDVTLRNVGSGFNITGYNSKHPSGIVENVTLRRVTVQTNAKELGGRGCFATIRTPLPGLVIEDCDGQTDGSSAIYFYGGPPAEGVFRRSRFIDHGYGIFHANHGEGIKALAPSVVWDQMTVINGEPKKYPAGTLFA